MKPPEQCKGTAVYKLLHFWRLTVIESTSFPRELPCCRHTFSQICMCLCRDVNSKRSFWNTPHERFCITWPHFMLFQTTYYPTHTDLFTVCLHRHYISTMRIWFYLLCSLLHPEHQEPCLACGRHWIKIWMNVLSMQGKMHKWESHSHTLLSTFWSSLPICCQPFVKVKDVFPFSFLYSKCKLLWHQYYFS